MDVTRAIQDGYLPFPQAVRTIEEALAEPGGLRALEKLLTGADAC